MKVSDQPKGDSPNTNDLSAATTRRPDPLLTASLYASGAIDEAITGWIVPLRARLLSLEGDSGRYLWLWRHTRHGEHLKLRIHADPGKRAELSQAVEETARGFLAKLQPHEPSAPSRSASRPPIDADEDSEPLPRDRSFRFTQYLRQAPILGNPLLQADDEYTDRFCRCSGFGHHWFLDELGTSGWSRELPATWFTIFFATAIEVAGIAPGSCLRTYRDWLIRLPLLKMKSTQQHADAWTLKLQQRSSAWDSGGFEDLPSALERASGTMAAAWREALVSLFDYARIHAETPAFERDPFARTILDLPLAKVLLALANALGLSMFDQAVLVHRLLATHDPELAAESLRLEAPSALEASR